MTNLTIAALAVAALLSWLMRDRRARGPRLVTDEPPIDQARLEAAEREVRRLPAPGRPVEPVTPGEGTSGPPPPPRRTRSART